MYSTVNVQHLESVSARIAEATGIVIEGTMPDRVIDDADGVVVVDLTPEAPRTRILEGKVFPAGSVPFALQRFFTKENLDVLREMALLQVVEEVEAYRLTAEMLEHEERLIPNVAAERQHRFLALVKPDPSANRIVRRAWSMSERLGGRLDLLWVAGERAGTEAEIGRRADDLRRLAVVFGAELVVERDRDVARAVTRAVERLGTTHLVMGVAHLRTRLGIPRRSLVDRIVRTRPRCSSRWWDAESGPDTAKDRLVDPLTLERIPVDGLPSILIVLRERAARIRSYHRSCDGFCAYRRRARGDLPSRPPTCAA